MQKNDPTRNNSSSIKSENSQIQIRTRSSKRFPASIGTLSLSLPLLLLITLLPQTTNAATIYVNIPVVGNADGTTWSKAYASIQTAIDNAQDNDEIWVARGTYYELIVLTSSISLYGGFNGTETTRSQRDHRKNVTTIDAEYGGSVVRMQFVFNTVLSGFVITGGNGFVIAGGSTVQGGGFFIELSNASNTISDCFIIRNRAVNGGGLFLKGSSPTIVNCIISGNTVLTSGGGTFTVDGSSPLIINCTFTANTARAGGGLDTHASSPAIVNCVFMGNTSTNIGGAIHIRGVRGPSFTNCTISGNNVHSSGGGVRFDGPSTSEALFTNCIFSDNDDYALVGGSWGSEFIINCLFYGNQDGDLSDELTGAAAINALPEVTNVVDGYPRFAVGTRGVWTGITTYDLGTDSTTLYDALADFQKNELIGRLIDVDIKQRHLALIISNTGTSITVVGDLTSVTAAGNEHYQLVDFHLEYDSAAIDTGTASGAPNTDIDGDVRQFHDIGVDEWIDDGFRPLDRVYVTTIGAGDGSSWANAVGTIQEGIDLARSGVEIWVADGVYPEYIISNSAVRIYGGFNATESEVSQRDLSVGHSVIDASGLRSSVVTMNRVTDARLDGFTVVGGKAIEGGGIYFKKVNASNTIENCVIGGNSAIVGGGNSMYSSSPSMINCIINGNFADFGGAFYLDNSSPSMTNCTISNNTGYSGGGLFLFESSPIVTNCILSSNTNTALFHNDDASYPRILDSLFFGNPDGDIYDFVSDSIVSGEIDINELARTGGNIVGDTRFLRTYSGSWNGVPSYDASTNTTILIDDEAVFTANELVGSFININIHQQFQALVIANSETSITITGNHSNLVVVGDESYELIDYHLDTGSAAVDAGTPFGAPNTDIEGDARPYNLNIDIGADEWTFTDDIIYVTVNGTGNGTDWNFALDSIQKAIDVAALADSPIWVARGTYNENIIFESDVSLYGGFAGNEALFSERDIGSNTTIIDATGLDITTVRIYETPGVILDGFTITGGNTPSFGGGIEIGNVSPTIANCIITGNAANFGGGGFFLTNSSAEIANCMIVDNYSPSRGAGLFLFSSSSPFITNCTILDNTAANKGGALYLYIDSDPIITNSIFVNNNSQAIYEYDTSSDAWLINNIFFSNPDGDYRDYGLGILTGAAAINALPEAADNLDGDPQFVGAFNADYHLQPTSPAIDSGIYTNAPAIDHDGILRPQGSGIDIGAYEFFDNTTEIAQAAHHNFDQYDADQNGTLSLAEWLNTGYTTTHFDFYDTNNDNQLTLEELLEAAGLTPHSLSTVHVDFSAATPGDGTIGAPFRTLAQALQMVTTNGAGIINIRPGTTSETFTNTTIINPIAKITLTSNTALSSMVTIGQ